MKWLNVLSARVRALLRRDAVLEDIEEELRLHVEMETQANVGRGMTPDEARTAARRSFGNAGRIEDMAYEIRGGGMLETFWQDLRYGARMLFKNPGFTAVAVVTLALGIGANTAIFSLVNATLLLRLPFAEPESLVYVYSGQQGNLYNTSSYPDYVEFREQTQVFTGLAARGGISASRLGHLLRRARRARRCGTHHLYLRRRDAGRASGRRHQPRAVAEPFRRLSGRRRSADKFERSELHDYRRVAVRFSRRRPRQG